METLFICFNKTDYKCPYCGVEKSDIDDKLLDRCNKNKSWTTKVKCECGKTFGVTFDIKGDIKTFKI